MRIFNVINHVTLILICFSFSMRSEGNTVEKSLNFFKKHNQFNDIEFFLLDLTKEIVSDEKKKRFEINRSLYSPENLKIQNMCLSFLRETNDKKATSISILKYLELINFLVEGSEIATISHSHKKKTIELLAYLTDQSYSIQDYSNIYEVNSVIQKARNYLNKKNHSHQYHFSGISNSRENLESTSVSSVRVDERETKFEEEKTQLLQWLYLALGW